ncbi:MAG: oxidoreductase, partial [Clostridia bacterium]|nr:oxidoreductase [Clostridia bacterium]
RAQQKRFEQPRIADAGQMRNLYRIRDLLVSQQVYLEAIDNYIACGGTSRGSCLITDESGEKPLESLPECFRFSLEDRGFGDKIQEMTYHPEGSTAHWRPVRPIPDEATWFEQVWRDYRNNSIYE